MSEDIGESSSKLGICQGCKQNEAKYKCPGCNLCSCSLPCVQKHKIENKCPGIRNRVQMVYKENMDNLTLLSDYRFLEEIDHKLEDGLRNPLRRSIVKGKESLAELPFHLKKLKLEARKRGTLLEFMPKHFSTHKENSSRYSYNEKKIRWHIKLIFPQADLCFIEKSVDEDTLLIDIIRKYMEPPNRLDDKESSLSEEELEKLSFYQSASYNRILVLFKSKMCRFDKRFVEMVLGKSLKTNLVKRKVVEYPVFCIVLKDHQKFYLDMESDSEEDISDSKANTFSDKKPVDERSLTQDFKNKLKVNSSKLGDDSSKLTYFETFSDYSSDMSD